VFCHCLFLWLAQPYVPHMHLTPGLNDSAHLPNIHSSALTWGAVYPNNAVFGFSLSSLVVTEGRCCTA
jgi:hypothetical protein